MFTKNDFTGLSASARNTIIEQTFDEAAGKQVNHSVGQIIAQGREPAVAARMISRPRSFPKCTLQPGGQITIGPLTSYDAHMIAGIFMESVKLNGWAPYPLTGDYWFNQKHMVRQLYLFIKGVAVARFDVNDVLHKDSMTAAELAQLTDPTPVLNSNYKCVAYISNLTTESLPQDYIGNYTGLSVHISAFKGSAPLVHII